MDHYASNEDISGQQDFLILPRVNLSGAGSGVGLGFALAYAQYDASSDDALSVMVSTDCGATWTELFRKSGTALSTTVPTNLDYAPTATEWRNEVVSLSAYAGQADVMLMFVTTSNHGNNLYLDDVNIASGLHVPGVVAGGISIYPNPTAGKLNVTFNTPGQVATIEVTDVVGRQVKSTNFTGGSGKMEMDLSDQPNGVYLVRVNAGGKVYQQKISVLK